MKPKVVRHKYGRLNNSSYEYIGRPSKFGNPFFMKSEADRDKVVQQFEEYARNNEWILTNINTLTNKEIGCFCAPKKCHGDVLVKLWEENSK